MYYVYICKDLYIALNGSEHFNENTKWSYVTINTRDLGGFMRQAFHYNWIGTAGWVEWIQPANDLDDTISPENPKNIATRMYH